MVDRKPFHGRRIGLITSGHLATNPRLVKEADALTQAGADVTVISAPFTELYKPFDRSLMETRRWRSIAVDVTPAAGRWMYGLRALQQRAWQRLPAFCDSIPGAAEGAFSRVSAALLHHAERLPKQDFYLAHNLAALPAAAAAAEQARTSFGFDLEDCHWGEFADDDDSPMRRRVRLLEDRYLPRCAHLTAASPLIAEHYRQRLGLKLAPVLNVFPLSERPSTPPKKLGGPLSLYWFSQTIGPGRGLEWAIAGLKRLPAPVQLTLRGNPLPGYVEHLRELARGHPLADHLRFEPVAPPDQMVPLCVWHDIGLSVEDGSTLNRRLCLTNKLFVYLLAGLPVVLSDTPAQRALAGDLGNSAVVARHGDAESLAAALMPWQEQPEKLRAARAQAWRLAAERFNWETEQARWLNTLQETLQWV